MTVRLTRPSQSGLFGLLGRIGVAAFCSGSFASSTWAQSPSAPAAPSPAPSAAAAPSIDQALRSGTFKSVVGNVRVQSANGVQREATSGSALSVLERVITGADGSAAVTLRDGTVITVGPGSNVSISAFSFEPTTQSGNLLVNVLEGSIRMLTGLLAKVNPQSIQVQTPTSLVGVRGTDFIVEVPKL